MIEHRPFLALGVLRRGGVDARRHFREGVDPALPGPLYGWDDVEFAPHSGLGMQVHRDVEIVTWVRSGAITHEDDAGNRVRLVADSVHVTSAGAAFHHAERNEENVPARQFRIWLRPRTPAGTARCATRVCSPGCRDGRFVTVASGDPDDVRAGALPFTPTHVCVSRCCAKARRCSTGCRYRAPPIWLRITGGWTSGRSGWRNAMASPFAMKRGSRCGRETTRRS